MAQVLESEWKEVKEVQAEEEEEEEEGREEKKSLPLDLLCSTYVFHLDGSDLGERVEGGQEGPSKGGWRGDEIPAAGIVEHGSVVAAICSRVLKGITFSIGISSSLHIFRRLGFPFFHPSGFLSEICGFFIRDLLYTFNQTFQHT